MTQKPIIPSRPTLPHMSLYVEKPVQHEIKRLAMEYDCRPHDVLIAALDLLFKETGRPSVAELTGGRRIKIRRRSGRNSAATNKGDTATT